MEIKVSAVVPVFNSVNTLARAINSLLIQPEIDEIFIVDDGSTDGSFELSKNLESKHSLVKVLNHEGRINKGASAARNLGLKYCKNEWIQFLDSDDELLLGKVQNQIRLTSEPVPFIIGVSKVVSSKRIFVRKPFSDIWCGLLFTRLGDTCCNLWNRKYLDLAGGWNEKLINSQDYDMIFRILRISTNIKFSFECNTVVYVSPNSISTGKDGWREKRENFIAQRVLVRDYLKDIGEFNLVRNYYYSAYVGSISRNSGIPVKEGYSKFLFFIYKSFKFLSDRL